MLKKIEVKAGDEYNIENYPTSGFYTTNNMILLILKDSSIALFISNYSKNLENEINSLFGSKAEQSTQMSDILKIIAVTQTPELVRDVL